MKLEKNKFWLAVGKSGKAIVNSLPILLAVVLLTGLMVKLIPKSWLANIFHFNVWLDSVLGAMAGSVLTGNPTSSYVLGGELLELGVGLAAVTAFVVSWVTVGIAQFPAEVIFLGRRFGLWRNLLSFVFSVLIGLLVYYLMFLF